MILEHLEDLPTDRKTVKRLVGFPLTEKVGR
jgi:hypothetical protein